MYVPETALLKVTIAKLRSCIQNPLSLDSVYLLELCWTKGYILTSMTLSIFQ